MTQLRHFCKYLASIQETHPFGGGRGILVLNISCESNSAASGRFSGSADRVLFRKVDRKAWDRPLPIPERVEEVNGEGRFPEEKWLLGFPVFQ